MLDFFQYYMAPSSPHRAKASIHLRAQSSAAVIPASERKAKALTTIAEVLGQVGVPVVDEAKLAKRFDTVDLLATKGRPDDSSVIDAVRSFLELDVAMAKDEVATVVEKGKLVLAEVLSLSKPKSEVDGGEIRANGTVDGAEHAAEGQQTALGNSGKAQVIDDVWSWKAGMEVSRGAKPVKDLSEFEELEPKL